MRAQTARAYTSACVSLCHASLTVPELPRPSVRRKWYWPIPLWSACGGDGDGDTATAGAAAAGSVVSCIARGIGGVDGATIIAVAIVATPTSQNASQRCSKGANPIKRDFHVACVEMICFLYARNTAYLEPLERPQNLAKRDGWKARSQSNPRRRLIIFYSKSQSDLHAAAFFFFFLAQPLPRCFSWASSNTTYPSRPSWHSPAIFVGGRGGEIWRPGPRRTRKRQGLEKKRKNIRGMFFGPRPR